MLWISVKQKSNRLMEYPVSVIAANSRMDSGNFLHRLIDPINVLNSLFHYASPSSLPGTPCSSTASPKTPFSRNQARRDQSRPHRHWLSRRLQPLQFVHPVGS